MAALEHHVAVSAPFQVMTYGLDKINITFTDVFFGFRAHTRPKQAFSCPS